MTAAADLNAVAVFATVVENQSFRAAARAMRIPKSTVSKRVSALEQRVGTRLLERTTRSLRLTEAGAAYYRAITPGLETLQAAEQALHDRQAQPAGRLRITAPTELGQTVLPEVLAEYMRRYPAVQVLVEFVARRVDLVKEGFDLALRAGLLASSSLTARKLGSPQPLLLYASPEYLERRGAPARPRDLARHDCLVMTSRQRPSTWQFRGRGTAAAVSIRGRLEVNSFFILRDLTLSGLGIAQLPRFIAGPLVRAGRLLPVLEEHALPATHWHAVFPSNRNLAPKVRAFIQLLEQRFRAPQTNPDL